ncbi:MAG TPA: oligopeptide/dipeptide ABC transporter ATP-binding protein [Oceanobacillus sp.]|nr:oligopeptide/dipeptide ABC transporter ATP-binding protein [Oceanobacillus sp.]
MVQATLQPNTVQDATEPLLRVRDLEVEYRTKRGVVRAVDHVSFDIYPNEVFGLAGESGCGKSTIAHAILRLLKPPAYIAGGSIMFGDTDVLALNEQQLSGFRWKQVSIVFQSAMNALNPVLTIGTQIMDAIQAHLPVSKQEARDRAVDHVSFDIYPNEVFGLAGESGCGKSTIAHAILRLLKPPAYIAGGSIMFGDTDVLALNEQQLSGFRWKQVSIVFQSAMNALNPVLTIGTQIMDAIQAHLPVSKQEARDRAVELLQLVGIDPSRINSYPHQLSGGMRQRVVIAIALTLNPQMIVLDEPTTALDVVVQKQIMDEIRELRKKFGFSILFISHDLSLMVEFSDRVGIMYAGELVEVAPSQEVFNHPQHPYTVKLMNSFPTITGERQELLGIPGSPPDLISPPPGCRFHPRCDVAIAGICQTIRPQLIEHTPNHRAACHLLDQESRS